MKTRPVLPLLNVKLNKINLRDLSQLLGYSKVAIPLISVILSPAGVSDSLNLLFNINRRDDILYYASNKRIVIGKWSVVRRELDLSSVIPKGSQI